MGAQKPQSENKHICAGILAHVDAGKTTLSEGMLYTSGSIRKMGRVDNKDAFLDTYELERARGITIFSKQAVMEWNGLKMTLLDTPGHVDFSAEMERTLQVLDYAVLVVSASDGVQGHTQTLWRLLKRYEIPVFIFINKMDQNGADRDALLLQLKDRLDDGCVDFSVPDGEAFYDALAMCAETAMEQFLENESVEVSCIRDMISNREVFPCFFGSALKLQGVEELLEGLNRYTADRTYAQEFAAKIFKIARDDQGNRLTYMKITGGCLKVRAVLSGTELKGGEEEPWEEKVNQIRIYSGAKFESVPEAVAGTVCAVTGLSHTKPGEGLGAEPDSALPVLEPVLTYQIILPDGCDAAAMLPKLRQLEEEEPQLHIVWDEQLKEIQAQLMGEVQLEILTSIMKERFGVRAEFGPGNIVYKETIADTAEGVGHFEPLRHYAEVHLLLEPGDPGSGMQFAASCSEDILDRNWQRLVLTHLEEKEHKGVLTGSALTDMKITLKSGRAHLKHTEGGDFRQATYRAVRQGLMQAQSVLLEPFYDFRLELPETMVGRAMTDIEKMHGNPGLPMIENGMSVLTGSAPVVTMRGYQKEVTEYTRGLGSLQCTLKGYAPCHNTDEVLESRNYDPSSDTANPSSSVFCAHGAGFLVEWYEVKDYMHLESVLTVRKPEHVTLLEEAEKLKKHTSVCSMSIGTDEVDQIISSTYQANKRDKSRPRKNNVSRKKRVYGSGHEHSSSQADGVSESLESGGTEEESESHLTGSGKGAVLESEPGRVKSEVYTPGGRKGTSEAYASGGKNGTSEAYTPGGRKGSSKDFEPGRKKESSVQQRRKYFLVDGYNIIFAWKELSELAKDNIDGARGRLLDIMCNYQAVKKNSLIVVFDAYRVEGHQTEYYDYHNIHVVFTKEAETADQYIERFAHENGRKYDVTVATSDGLEQIIIQGQGCRLVSARELEEEIQTEHKKMYAEYLGNNMKERNMPFEEALRRGIILKNRPGKEQCSKTE